jgi:hypothetical protein
MDPKMRKCMQTFVLILSVCWRNVQLTF